MNCMILKSVGAVKMFAAMVLSIGAMSVLADRVISENVTLTEDADWRADGTVEIAEGVTVDINGHVLQISGLTGAGEITGTVGGGELHVDVPEGKTVENATVSITGGIKLFKDGAGTFCATKTGQTYAGGTEVTAGTLKARSNCYPWTPSIVIDAGAVLDINGANVTGGNAAIGDNWYTLNGGAMANLYANVTWDALHRIRLTADSSFIVNKTIGIQGYSWAETFLQLNGHTFNFEIPRGANFSIGNCTISNGTIKVVGGGAFKFWKKDSRSTDLTLDVGTELQNDGASVTLKNLIVRHTGAGTWFGSGNVYVDGVYTPITDYIGHFVLKDGATIDLRTRVGAWSTASTVNANKLAIEGNATITLDLAGRTDLEHGLKVLAFGSEMPASVTFLLDDVSSKRFFAVRKEDGVELGAKSLTILVR